MTIQKTVALTGGQLRVLHETLSLVMNDPDWAETTVMTDREWQTLGTVHEKIMESLQEAKRDDTVEGRARRCDCGAAGAPEDWHHSDCPVRSGSPAKERTVGEYVASVRHYKDASGARPEGHYLGVVTKVGGKRASSICRHYHATQGEAQKCADSMADRRNR